MPAKIELFNKFRDIQNTPTAHRVVKNFGLYRDLFNHITLQNNDELKTLNANLYFIGNNGDEFHHIVDDKFLDLYFDLNKVDTKLFDDFIFQSNSIMSIIESCCFDCGLELSDVKISTLFNNAYESWDNYLNRIGYDEKNLITSPETEKMKKSLLEKHIVWCHNKSCSGKTYTAIGLLKSHHKHAVFNPCFNLSCNYEFVKLLLTLGQNFTLLIDDIQCDVEKAKEIFEFIHNNYLSFPRRNIKVFIVSWSSLLRKNEFQKYAVILPSYETNPNDYIELLKRKVPDHTLLSICGENIALLNAASKVELHDTADSSQKLFNVFVCTQEVDKLKQIYHLCVLGIYEYSASCEYLGAPIITSDDLNTLKISDSTYYAGHREICSFIVSFIEKSGVKGLPERHTIIRDFILSVDNSMKWKTLKQLVGEHGFDDLQAVSPIWNTLNCFENEIFKQTRKDPSWDSTPSSMYFVLNTAALLGIAEEYTDVLKSLCSKITISNSKPLVSLKYDRIKTTNDFEQIKRRMIEEDKNCSDLNYEAGRDFDCNQSHKNWILGLVVGLKQQLINAGFKDIYDNAVNELFSSQTVDGYWYPKRVPWVTARILIGLSQAGYTISNPNVSSAVSFLLESLGNESFWVANTGGWNSIYETSSLCLEAIFRSGYSYSNNSDILRVAHNLLAQKDEWMAAGNEIDGSATACSLVKILGIKGDLLSYITELCHRCIYDTLHSSDSLNINKMQSCTTTQIASYTIELCWHIFERDLPSLLEQFIKRSTYSSTTTVENVEDQVKTVFISYSEDSKSHIQRVKKISDHLKKQGYIVYFYADAPIGTNNIEFMQNAENCDLILLIGTPQYKAKAITIKAGGVFFEEQILGATFMNQKYESIVPIAFGDFADSFPTPFNNNKGMPCKRVDAKFLDRLAEAIHNKLGGN